MSRVKTFIKYALWLILFTIFSKFMINVGLNTMYKSIEAKSNLSQVNIKTAEVTSVDGRLYGEIDLDKNSNLIGQYLKVDLYSKNNVLLGTDYIKIEKTGDESKQKIEEYFKYDNVKSYDLSIIDEAQMQKEVNEIKDKSLFEGFTTDKMSIGEKLWIAIIAVAILF